PHVLLPMSGPMPVLRNIHGSASPPEPAISLMIITLGPKMPSIGVVMSKPSRCVKKLRSGRREVEILAFFVKIGQDCIAHPVRHLITFPLLQRVDKNGVQMVAELFRVSKPATVR